MTDKARESAWDVAAREQHVRVGELKVWLMENVKPGVATWSHWEHGRRLIAPEHLLAFMKERNAARSVQSSDLSENDQDPRWQSLRDPDEKRLMFPLMAVILDLYRSKNDFRFQHLLNQMGLLIDHDNHRANASLAKALDAFEEILARRPQPPTPSKLSPPLRKVAKSERGR